MPVEPALAERPLQVQAVALHRVDLAVDAGERELPLADLHTGERAGFDLFQLRDGFVVGHALDPTCAGC